MIVSERGFLEPHWFPERRVVGLLLFAQSLDFFRPGSAPSPPPRYIWATAFFNQIRQKHSGATSDLFSRVLFSFLPPLLVTPLPPLFSAPFSPFPPLKNPLFCRGRGTAQSLERGSFRMDLSTNFGKEIPSRNPREKRSDFCLKHYKTRCTPEKRDRIENPRHGQHPERDQNEIRSCILWGQEGTRQGSMPVYTRIFLIGVRNVLKHL